MSRRRNQRNRQQPQQRQGGGTATLPNPDYTTAKALPSAGNATGRPQGRTLTEVLNALTAQQSYGTAIPMPRDSLDAVPFGPINPLKPAPISPARADTGRPEPRIREYPPGWNIPGNDNRLIPWDVLYNAADQVDIMRRCIEVRKRHVRSLKWNFNVTTDAIAAAYRADPKFGRDDLESQLRDKYWPHINRLTEFWTKPWRTNGLNLGQWVNAVQDQHLVLDAVAIYPRTTYGGDVFALEILDGSTIKPLIDWRGDRPAPPMPAFQQEIYGFPRGEYTATTEIDADGNEILTGGLFADQLYYWREVFRPRSFYGFSAVEQALMAARLYVKRQGWMLSEYEDGSTPMTWLVPDHADSIELDPRQRTEWERAINDDLSGQTAARHRIKLSYPGFRPEMMPSVDERYKPDYDLYLIKLLAAHFGVPIAELGFTESKGLGSSGYHEGQEDVMDRVGRRPDVAILEEIINDVSHRWLGAPPEVEFSFLGLESEDEAAQDAVADARVRSGRMTYNEDRKRLGLPLYDFAEADMPIVIGQRGIVFIENASQLAPAGEMIEPAQAPPDTPQPDDGADSTDASADKPAAKPAPDNRKPAGDKSKPADTAKAADPTAAVADSDSTRDRVRAQLAEDYPPASMKWLKQAVWSGPETVPTADIDYSNEDQWAASKEPAKVDRFTEKIGQGRLKPIILVNTPDSRNYIVIDGHHRALAYRKLGIPAMAYIGRVGRKTGDWDTMHASQRTNSSGPTEKALDVEALDRKLDEIQHYHPLARPSDDLAKAIADELAAYRRWAKRNPHPRRPFTFEYPEAEQLAKAGGADPKAPRSARSWPGWDRDLATAAYYSARLRSALAAGVPTGRIAQAWADARGLTKDAAPTAGTADAGQWLYDYGVLTTITGILERVLGDAYAEGYVIGARAAGTLVDTGSSAVDWGGWTPGDVDAANLVLGHDGLGAGLQQLLDSAGVTIKSIGQGRFDELAQALALSLERGDSSDTLARDLADILDNGAWADLVATTEIARAVSAASMQTYAANGVEATEWLISADGRVCPICEGNADDGPVPLGAAYSSGDTAPPGHPRCRCSLAPTTMPAADAAAFDTEPGDTTDD